MCTENFIYKLSVLVVLTSPFFFSCDKDEVEIEEVNKLSPLGTLTAEATLNDTQKWQANRVFGIENSAGTYFISAGYFVNSHCLIEHIGFSNIPLRLGKINLVYDQNNSKPTARYYAYDCDAIGERYHLLESENVNHYLEINTIGISEIQGTFQMTLVRDTARPKIIFPNRPDTLRLTDGSFNAEILSDE